MLQLVIAAVTPIKAHHRVSCYAARSVLAGCPLHQVIVARPGATQSGSDAHLGRRCWVGLAFSVTTDGTQQEKVQHHI